MKLEDEIINIVRDVLVLGDRADDFSESTALMGDIPEFDSMSVVAIITALEEEYGCVFEDDEITADVFKTIGSLTQLVESKL
ncbi:acyl carrier protein [Nitrosomonas aestuarii]|mgnify:CR=1 FL=1|uniref:Phosphopantetheine attachment site n=1 Tax=Nitrosomonas aestuarii TaxID=52441 RepID=A0A1I4CSY6_9PROT|nr:acyl carrier protein [Nitrosomonas aestuarii]PTN11805.1 phosphopantetheine binding protein [Nitrosomonas aestuarii]SFK83750.1 Phosphopantetheine attachment site [Nitrosomonas aestuarii]